MTSSEVVGPCLKHPSISKFQLLMTPQEHRGLRAFVFFCRAFFTSAIKMSKTNLNSPFNGGSEVRMWLCSVSLTEMYQVTFVHLVNLKAQMFCIIAYFCSHTNNNKLPKPPNNFSNENRSRQRRQVQPREHNYLGTTQALAKQLTRLHEVLP